MTLGTLPKEHFGISPTTFRELEEIKTNRNKDASLKYAARQVTRELWDTPEKYTCCSEISSFDEKMLSDNYGTITNDLRILLCAMNASEVDTLVTEDLCLANIAKEYITVERLSDHHEDVPYYGYVEKCLDNDALTDFYTEKTKNTQNLLQNEYLILKDENNKVDDVYCWRGPAYNRLSYSTFSSKYMNPVIPKDIYQKMAADALEHNQFVMLTGKAGTAKTLLSLSYAMQEIEKGRKKKLIVFANPVSARNSAEIGFLKGDKNEKLLDSSIGNILAAKLGGRDNVEKLIGTNKLELLTFADLRGYDTTGMNAVVLVTEAQNLDVYLLQLAAQRIGEDCQFIVEGDYTAQVDSAAYEGSANGMKRISEVFRGYEDYAQVELRNIYRSGIAKKALEM